MFKVFKHKSSSHSRIDHSVMNSLFKYMIWANACKKALEFRLPELGRETPLSGKRGRKTDQKNNLGDFTFFALGWCCVKRAKTL